MQQLIIRSGSRCYLVMITLEATSDTPAHIEEIEQTLSHMEQAILNTIRRVDICTRYSSMQYLIILFQPVEAQIPNIMERIFMQYYKQAKSTNFLPTYKYLSMTENNMDTNQKYKLLTDTGFFSPVSDSEAFILGDDHITLNISLLFPHTLPDLLSHASQYAHGSFSLQSDSCQVLVHTDPPESPVHLQLHE